MTKQYDSIWVNANLARCETGYDAIKNAAIGVKNGRIAWVSSMHELPAEPDILADAVYDINGRWLTPGFIDCHTHLVYAGNRAHEFEMRLKGMSYQDIAKQGGGIQSTVLATREASFDELYQHSVTRAKMCLANGTTTLEIKSGYGLDWETEKKILRVAAKLNDELPLTIKRTFLGAHSVPHEYKENSDAYIDLVCGTMIPAVASERLANAVDVFCETIAFSLTQTERVFQSAKDYGLAIKCHAEQLSDLGASSLAASYQAISVDHLEHLSNEGVLALANSNTVAVLLPGAFYFLKESKKPPIDELRQAGVVMAIATDANPGTSPACSLPLMMNMACVMFGMTPEEALLGVTKHAAKAVEMDHECGSLTVGKKADFLIWNINHPADISYYIGSEQYLESVVKDGHLI